MSPNSSFNSPILNNIFRIAGLCWSRGGFSGDSGLAIRSLQKSEVQHRNRSFSNDTHSKMAFCWRFGGWCTPSFHSLKLNKEVHGGSLGEPETLKGSILGGRRRIRRGWEKEHASDSSTRPSSKQGTRRMRRGPLKKARPPSTMEGAAQSERPNQCGPLNCGLRPQKTP